MPGGRRAPSSFTAKEYIGPPVGGWSPDVPTWELPPDQAYQLVNFMPRPGKIRVRPSFKVTADLSAHVPLTSPAGMVPLRNGSVVLSRRLYTATYKVEPWNIHRVGAGSPSGTTPSDSNVYVVDKAGNVTVKTVPQAGMAPGWQYVDFNGTKYALSYSGLLNAVLGYSDNSIAWATGVLHIADDGSITAYAFAHQGGADIYGWLSRLWVLGGLPLSMSGSFAKLTTLYFTRPLAALTNTAADWNDPVSGLVNQIELDGDYTDPGVALASVPAGLLILRQKSLFIIRGTDPTTWTVRPVSRQTGCLDARSVVETDNTVYWMSQQGLMVTNGTSVQNVSGTLQDELLRQIATWNDQVHNSYGAWCTCTLLSGNKLLVSFGYPSSPSASGYVLAGALSAILDLDTGVWVEIKTNIMPTSGTHYLGPSVSGYGTVMSIGNAPVLEIENESSGKFITGPPALWDESDPSGTTTPIDATWITRSPQLALGSRQKTQLKRAYVDYQCYTGGPTASMEVQLLNRAGPNSEHPFSNTTAAMDTAASGYRQVYQQDVANEVADLGVEITLSGDSGAAGASGDAVPAAEIHGVGVEFQPTSDMRPAQ